MLLLLVALLLPDAAPLGMFCFGNLMRERGVVERLSDTVQNALINIVTIFSGCRWGQAGGGRCSRRRWGSWCWG
nr:sodium ion-translocating decarboxylase subunit beta [Klebsiella variicola]